MNPANPDRNPRLDALLAELNGPLQAAESRLLAALSERERAVPRSPVVLVVGAPRSGTTVLVQWLQATGAFCVPTNVMARFAAAPGLAARLELALFDREHGYGEQLADLAAPQAAFASDLGKTRGALAPNEFFHFWRRHLGHEAIEPMGEERVRAVDWARVRAELAAVEAARELPFASKGLMLQYDLPAVAAHLPEALFVHVERDPFFNAQSLLRARRTFHGSESRWYSTRPPGAADFDDRDPLEQVAGQVGLDNAAIRAGCAGLPADRSIHVAYEDFCADTGALWGAVRERFAARGAELPVEHAAPRAFETTNRVTLEPERADRLRAACTRFPGMAADDSVGV